MMGRFQKATAITAADHDAASGLRSLSCNCADTASVAALMSTLFKYILN